MAPEPLAIESIGQIAISVKDVERATAFYRDTLGLRFLFAFPGMAFFDCGGVRLYLTRPQQAEHAHASILYYRVADIRAAAATLESRGVVLLQQPVKVHEDDRHELWLAGFNDSEGNTLELMSEELKHP
jgi:methylmalonyl-CoA/ethylmalonyl-CoA epimerase